MSEEIKLSLTAARMVIGLKGKKHYTIPTQVTLAKMDDDFEVELATGKERGKAGDYIGLNYSGGLMLVEAEKVGTTYRPARSPKKVKPVPTVDK